MTRESSLSYYYTIHIIPERTKINLVCSVFIMNKNTFSTNQITLI